MAANPNWTEAVTATLQHRRKKLADTVTKNNILLFEMRRRGRQKTIAGGLTISTPIMIGEENTNFMWYQGREPLNVNGMEVLTSAEVPWKQYACGVSISGLEILQNSGPEQILNMLEVRIQHAEKTIQNQLHRSSHGDGTGSGGKELGGIRLMISDVAGATVGGISAATYTWWDNQRLILGSAPTSSNIYSSMLNMHMACSRGTDKPNLILSDNSYYAVYANSLQSQQRFMDKSLANAGFENVMFHMTPVVYDGGIGGFAQTGAMRFINLETIELIMHKARNNVVLSGPRRPLNEDSDTVIIAGMGNWVPLNRMLNGVMKH